MTSSSSPAQPSRLAQAKQRLARRLGAFWLRAWPPARFPRGAVVGLRPDEARMLADLVRDHFRSGRAASLTERDTRTLAGAHARLTHALSRPRRGT